MRSANSSSISPTSSHLTSNVRRRLLETYSATDESDILSGQTCLLSDSQTEESELVEYSEHIRSVVFEERQSTHVVADISTEASESPSRSLLIHRMPRRWKRLDLALIELRDFDWKTSRDICYELVISNGSSILRSFPLMSETSPNEESMSCLPLNWSLKNYRLESDGVQYRKPVFNVSIKQVRGSTGSETTIATTQIDFSAVGDVAYQPQTCIMADRIEPFISPKSEDCASPKIVGFISLRWSLSINEPTGASRFGVLVPSDDCGHLCSRHIGWDTTAPVAPPFRPNIEPVPSSKGSNSMRVVIFGGRGMKVARFPRWPSSQTSFVRVLWGSYSLESKPTRSQKDPAYCTEFLFPMNGQSYGPQPSSLEIEVYRYRRVKVPKRIGKATIDLKKLIRAAPAEAFLVTTRDDNNRVVGNLTCEVLFTPNVVERPTTRRVNPVSHRMRSRSDVLQSNLLMALPADRTVEDAVNEWRRYGRATRM